MLEDGSSTCSEDSFWEDDGSMSSFEGVDPEDGTSAHEDGPEDGNSRGNRTEDDDMSRLHVFFTLDGNERNVNLQILVFKFCR